MAQQREISGFGFKIFIIGSLALSYFGFQSIRRTPKRQVYNIKHKFSNPLNFLLPQLPPIMHRQEEELLTRYFAAPPAGPLVIVGPDGAGRGWALKSVLNDRRMAMFLDLRRFPVTNKNEFMHHVIQETGYMIPPMDFFVKWLLREKNVEKKPRIDRVEVDKALNAIQEMLRKEKKKGWQNGVPIIAIHRLESFENQDSDQKESKGGGSPDNEMSKFLSFCLWLSDNKLAHVIITANRVTAKLLDDHPGWLSRREIFFIPFATNDEIIHYLQNEARAQLQQHNINLSDNEINEIVKVLGGCLGDIGRLILSLVRGQKVEEILHTLVGESVNTMNSHLESILADTKEKDDDKFKKYIRAWKLMETFSTKNSVSRISLQENLFADNLHELSAYEKKEILLMLNVSQSHILKSHSESNIGEFTMVTPGTPRMASAFRIIISDPKSIEQKTRIEAALKKSKLKSKKKQILEDEERLVIKKRDILAELKIIVENVKAIEKTREGVEISMNPSQPTSEHVKRLLSNLDDINNQLNGLDVELLQIEKTLNE